MKKLKRLVTCILVITMFIFAFSQRSVLAASTYRIDEMELSLSVPSGYSVITRDTPTYDPIFNKLGVSGVEVIGNFIKNNIYFNAVSNTYNEEIVVTNSKNNLTNFSLLSDTVLNTFATSFINEYENRGINVSKYDIYQHSQAKFVRVYWYDSATFSYGLQYYTIYNGNAMNFTMRSYNSAISTRQEQVIKSIVDSVKYDEAPPIKNEVEDTYAFSYTDEDSGTKFIVPANWVEKEFNEEREYLDVKFVSTKEDGCLIIFSSTDLWSKMTPVDRLGMVKSDIDNSMFSNADIAEMNGILESEVSRYMYNGIEYYKCEKTASKDMYGTTFDITMTLLLRIEDGWMYSFQFGGTSSHPLYSDFESLIKSVEYAEPQIYPLDNYSYDYDANTNTINEDDESGNYTGGIVAFVVIMAVTGVVCIVIYFASRKKEKHMIIYCSKCGEALEYDSEFCHMCGTKVERFDER